jgi:hypothetical protein
LKHRSHLQGFSATPPLPNAASNMAAEDSQARKQPHDYGKASEFFTASEHHRFCAVTTFLEMTNSFEDRLTDGLHGPLSEKE